MSNEHIPNNTILQDIQDTEREIIQMKREEQGLRLLGDRLSLFKAVARRDGIKEREEFMVKLKEILKQRGVINVE